MLLSSMRSEIERHGEKFFQPHPDPERIVEYAEGRMAAEMAEEVRQHLSFCWTCAVEARIVRHGPGEIARTHGRRASPRRLGWRRILPWAAAAAVLAALALPVREWRRSSLRTDVVQAFYIEPPQRDAAATVVRIPASEPAFQLVLPVDLVPGSLPLTVEIRDRDDRVIFRRDDVSSVYRGMFLFVLCDRRDFPDGEYVVRIQPLTRQGKPPTAPTLLRFRVASDE